MKSITVSSRARTVQQLLKQALRESLVLRTKDGRAFILAEIAQFDRDIELARPDNELQRMLVRRGKEKATIPLSEIKVQFGLK